MTEDDDYEHFEGIPPRVAIASLQAGVLALLIGLVAVLGGIAGNAHVTTTKATVYERCIALHTPEQCKGVRP